MLTERIVFSKERNVTLDVFVPEISNEMPNMNIKPAVLVLPGGGYSMCSDREAEPVAFEFIAKGYNVFILRYSLNENALFPTPLEDAIWALKTIRENSTMWHTDPQKIAVCGFSAGGHLAAALSTMSDEKPNACILGYPCILEEIGNILAKPIPSLEVRVSDKTPPTFIVSASDDDIVPIENSLKYADALNKNNIPFEMHIFSKGGHGFSTSTEVVTIEERQDFVKNTIVWIDMCIKWLKTIF